MIPKWNGRKKRIWHDALTTLNNKTTYVYNKPSSFCVVDNFFPEQRQKCPNKRDNKWTFYETSNSSQLKKYICERLSDGRQVGEGTSERLGGVWIRVLDSNGVQCSVCEHYRWDSPYSVFFCLLSVKCATPIWAAALCDYSLICMKNQCRILILMTTPKCVMAGRSQNTRHFNAMFLFAPQTLYSVHLRCMCVCTVDDGTVLRCCWQRTVNVIAFFSFAVSIKSFYSWCWSWFFSRCIRS